MLNKFRIFETRQFISDLEEIPGSQQERLRIKLETYIYPQLKQQPYFGKNIKKLVNYKPETWRYRIGDYRFFYEIEERRKIIFMISADLRGRAYK